MRSQLPPTYGYFDRHKFNNTANFVYRTFVVTHSVVNARYVYDNYDLHLVPP